MHTSHSRVGNPGRQKTYLIATYTGLLTEADINHEWFIPYVPSSGDSRVTDAQTEPLVDSKLQRMIAEKYQSWQAKEFFEEDPMGGPYPQEPSCTTPHTDAGVTVTLVGTKGESGKQRLVHEGEDAEIFRPGHVDEFAVTCTDIGELTALIVQHDNNGSDWSSSRWKLDKIVVTCLQSQTEFRDDDGGYWSPRGDHVEKSMTTWQSSQWHFVPVRTYSKACTPLVAIQIDPTRSARGRCL